MKKSLAIVLAAASILTVSGSASALNIAQANRPATIDGQPSGTVTPTALPAANAAGFCGYRLLWADQFNPTNLASICNGRENITAQVPGCAAARTQNFNTLWSNDGQACSIQDPTGQTQVVGNFNLVLGEFAGTPSLNGALLSGYSPVAVGVVIV